jgi:hypothetical protein
MSISLILALAIGFIPQLVTAQDTKKPDHAAMDHRGHEAMGFDQAKITHTFSTADRGGTVQIVAKDAKDSVTVSQIRAHLKEIARLVTAGDFSKPVFIHAQDPPGIDVMKRRRREIDYGYQEMASGGRLTISSSQPDAVAAIHRFLRFQQDEHKR